MESVISDKRMKMVASGKFFERKVASIVNQTIPCKFFLNYEIYSRHLGRGTECDLLVLTSTRVYCVECKNYNGFISARKFKYDWFFASTGRKGRVQNPYLLNRKHVRIMRSAFYERGLNPIEIENVIVVPDGCSINGDDCNIMRLSEFVAKVKFDYESLGKIYNVDSLYKFFKMIKWEG